jgi:hypothetical protein
MIRCPHGICDNACPDCHPSSLGPPVPLESPGDELEMLRGQLHAVQCLLIAEREEVSRLRLELEYEAFVANRDFWSVARAL